jgi:hypothetical protein
MVKYKTIEQLYLKGLSTGKIAKIYQVCSETIRYQLQKLGVKLRTREEACTKYKLDKTFFNSINTEEKAYWLGFLTADGGIVKHQLVLSLKASDVPHIQLFRNSLHSTHPIKNSTTKINNKIITQPRLVISSIDLIKSLKSLGVGERKSLTVRPPKFIPELLQAAYWRGYFDGDGHIQNLSNRRTIELTGNHHMLSGFKKFIKKTLQITGNIKKSKSVYCIRYSKRSAIFAISKLLYSNSKIHLNRKYEIAHSVFNDEFFHLRKNSKYRPKHFSLQAKDKP